MLPSWIILIYQYVFTSVSMEVLAHVHAHTQILFNFIQIDISFYQVQLFTLKHVVLQVRSSFAR